MAGLFDFLGSALGGGGGFQSSDMAAFGSPLPAIGGMSGATSAAPQDSISAFLGSLGGDQPIGMGGDTSALPTQAPGDNRGFFARLTDPHSGLRHGIGDFLGNLGDALLQASGNEPMYAPRQQKKQLGAAMSQFLGANTPLGQLAMRDPESAATLYKLQQEGHGEGFSLSPGQIRYGPDGKIIAQAPGGDSSDATTFVRNLQALGIDPHSPEAMRLYYASVSPAGYLINPPSGSGGGAQSLPHVSTPEQAHSLPPGTRFVLPDGRIGTVPGGGVSNGTGGF